MATVPDAVRSPGDADDQDALKRRHVVPSELGEVSVDTEGDQPRITVPISSTTPHRSDGKIMTEEALESMAEQLESGEVGLWDDHGLSVLTGWREYRREDMYGRWVAGEVDEDGILWGTAELMDDRDETDTLLEQLAQDMPVGFSVGYKPLDEEMLAVAEDDEDKTRHIFDVDLWETSPVGIPDNPAAIASVAGAIEQADVDIGPELASTVATSVREALESTMTDTDTSESTDSGSDPEGSAGTTPPAVRFNDSEVEEIMGIVGGALESAMTDAMAEMEQELQDSDEGGDGSEEEEGGDDDGDDDDDDENEESAGVSFDRGGQDGSDTPDAVAELQERLDALEAQNQELEERLEEKEATIERLESESRESAGRKGISPPASSGGDDGDGGEEPASGDGGQEASSSNRPQNALDEAMRLGGN